MLESLTGDSDERLVKRAIDGSQAAWHGLIRRYDRRLYNYAYRIVGNPDDATDMLQEILVAVHRNLATWRGDGSFPAWLFRIAAYRCTDYLRRRRHFDDIDAHPELETSQSGPEQFAELASINQKLVAAMAQLPTDQRIVIELKFFQQFTFDDIAQQLSISANTAKTRLYTGLRKLRAIEGLADAL